MSTTGIVVGLGVFFGLLLAFGLVVGFRYRRKQQTPPPLPGATPTPAALGAAAGGEQDKADKKKSSTAETPEKLALIMKSAWLFVLQAVLACVAIFFVASFILAGIGLTMPGAIKEREQAMIKAWHWVTHLTTPEGSSRFIHVQKDGYETYMLTPPGPWGFKWMCYVHHHGTNAVADFEMRPGEVRGTYSCSWDPANQGYWELEMDPTAKGKEVRYIGYQTKSLTDQSRFPMVVIFPNGY